MSSVIQQIYCILLWLLHILGMRL